MTDATTGAPLPSATVSTSGGYQLRTDSTGHYDLSVIAGSYDVTAAQFGYKSATTTGAQVTQDQTTTVNFALTPMQSATLSGTVTDGSGHGWPLYAKISIDGYPDGTVFTDPRTGRYTVRLPQQNTWTLHVTAADAPGYVAQTVQVPIGTADALSRDVSLGIDTAACTAPGYG